MYNVCVYVVYVGVCVCVCMCVYICERAGVYVHVCVWKTYDFCNFCISGKVIGYGLILSLSPHRAQALDLDVYIDERGYGSIAISVCESHLRRLIKQRI